MRYPGSRLEVSPGVDAIPADLQRVHRLVRLQIPVERRPGRAVERHQARLLPPRDRCEVAAHEYRVPAGRKHIDARGVVVLPRTVRRRRPVLERPVGGVEGQQVEAIRTTEDVFELAPRVHRALADCQGIHDPVGVHLPRQHGAARGVHGRQRAMEMSPHLAEPTACIERIAAHRQRDHAVVGIGIPVLREARHRVHRRQVAPPLAADLAESSSHVHRAVPHEQRQHGLIRIRTPRGRQPRLGVKGSQIGSGLAADLAEVPARVDLSPARRQRVDDQPVGVGVPVGQLPGLQVERRQVAA